MRYRVSVAFEVESGHMLMKHPGKCRFPHGHTRRVEVVVSAAELDQNDMVCDFKAIKLAVGKFIERLDHALALNSDDPAVGRLEDYRERLVLIEGRDPTTEVLAKSIYDELAGVIATGRELDDAAGVRYALPAGLRVERVRVGETTRTWAEYGVD